MTSVPGAGVILTNDRKSLIDIHLKRKSLVEVEEEKDLFLFNISNNSNLIRFVSEYTPGPEGRGQPKITLELIDPSHEFENHFLRMSNQLDSSFLNKFDKIDVKLSAEMLAEHKRLLTKYKVDLPALDNAKKIIKDLEEFMDVAWWRPSLEGFGPGGMAKLFFSTVNVLNRPNLSDAIRREAHDADDPMAYMQDYQSGVENDLLKQKAKLTEMENTIGGGKEELVTFALDKFLSDVKERNTKFFISYGAGDNIGSWAGPFAVSVVDASMEITHDNVRLKTLEFVPDTGYLTLSHGEGLNLKLSGYGSNYKSLNGGISYSEPMAGYSKPMLGTPENQRLFDSRWHADRAREGDSELDKLNRIEKLFKKSVFW